MKIIVCIKQVPASSKIRTDEKTGVLIRDGVETKINPYDLYALETALRLKESHNAQVTVVTMGPMQSVDIIKEAYMMGADSGIVISDKAFAGADVLATSYTLSQGIKKSSPFDIIICGKQTTDGDTAQVGAEIAEYLDIPHVTNVSKIIDVKDDYLHLEVDMGDTLDIIEIERPCLIAVDKGIYVPRLPSYLKKIATAHREIIKYSLNDLEDNEHLHYGLNGSPTQVERIFPPEVSAEKHMIKGDSEDVAQALYDKLRELKFI